MKIEFDDRTIRDFFGGLALLVAWGMLLGAACYGCHEDEKTDQVKVEHAR